MRKIQARIYSARDCTDGSARGLMPTKLQHQWYEKVIESSPFDPIIFDDPTFGLELLASPATGILENWMYQGIPIFFSPTKSGKFQVMVYYGFHKLRYKNLYRAMSALDTLLVVRYWQYMLPIGMKMNCPACGLPFTRDKVFPHYVNYHLIDLTNTVESLSRFKHHFAHYYAKPVEKATTDKNVSMELLFT